MAANLARFLVRVVVERLAGVADLNRAAAALDGSEQRRLDALTGHRLAVREDWGPRLRAVAVADALALRVLLEDVDGLSIGVEEHRAELGLGGTNDGSIALSRLVRVWFAGCRLVVLGHGGTGISLHRWIAAGLRFRSLVLARVPAGRQPQ